MHVPPFLMLPTFLSRRESTPLVEKQDYGKLAKLTKLQTMLLNTTDLRKELLCFVFHGNRR